MNIKSLLCFISILSLWGCSNSPREVEADVPLVTQYIQPSGVAISTKYRQLLEEPHKSSISHHTHKIEIGPTYTSSLGQDCRELTLYDQNGEKTRQAACTHKKQYEEQIRAWYLIPNIVHHESNLKL